MKENMKTVEFEQKCKKLKIKVLKKLSTKKKKNKEKEIINNPKKILEEVIEFYSNLWGKSENENEDGVTEYLHKFDKQILKKMK